MSIFSRFTFLIGFWSYLSSLVGQSLAGAAIRENLPSNQISAINCSNTGRSPIHVGAVCLWSDHEIVRIPKAMMMNYE